jgi:ribosomal protein L11 methyltransferase
LLTTQARRVAAAYTARGLRLVDRIDRGEWPTLVLRRR